MKNLFLCSLILLVSACVNSTPRHKVPVQEVYVIQKELQKPNTLPTENP